ncbi:MAG TPA: HAD-IIIA family hydrolase [Candidatus Binataceae bacterium]|nr:HAD-IIIA family hydrolase [Candidatus Binataceae bacterium]
MAGENGNRALFCDLVGTLVKFDENRELPLDAAGNVSIELLPGVAEKLAPIRDALICIVTNQAGIARGRLTLEKVEAAIAEVDRQLGGIVFGWQICPHQQSDVCECRKPKAGMIKELVSLYGIDLAASTMIGDQEIDAECARIAGVGEFVYAKDFFASKQ